MYRSPSPLAEAARSRLADTLNARLADGLDLLTGAILEFEKHGWFLRASLAG